MTNASGTAYSEWERERLVYWLQDLKCFVFSLISSHFKIQPIQR